MHPVIPLVEDLESLRHTIQQILEEADFLVLPAANAVQALELAQSCAGSVDLLITNRARPGFSFEKTIAGNERPLQLRQSVGGFGSSGSC